MKIDHIALYVADLEAARGFFERFFGATAGPEYHNPATGLRTYFLSFGGGARLEFMTRPGLAATPGRDSAWATPTWPSPSAAANASTA